MPNLCDAPNLFYFRKITTDKGIWQHAVGKEPDQKMGYSIDDIARALIVVNGINKFYPALNSGNYRDKRPLKDLAQIFLNFIEVNQLPKGNFNNFVSAKGEPLSEPGSPDSFGRTVWALGNTIQSGVTDEQKKKARELFESAGKNFMTNKFIRTEAFILLGIAESYAASNDSSLQDYVQGLLTDMLNQYKANKSADWLWFEPELKYSNAMLPYALLKGAAVREKSNKALAAEARTAAFESLDFLIKETTHENVPAPIGNKGWYKKGGAKALYDQQPVDAAGMVIACLEAWKVSNKEEYKKTAETWLKWYEGTNVAQKPMIDEEDGAIHDGINEGNSINPNCGAESSVSYLLARLKWTEYCCQK